VVSRGEIWWAAPAGEKRRPYLVVMRDTAIAHLHHVIAIPATRTVRSLPSEVELDEADGMPERCALNADTITQLAHTDFDEFICALPPPRMREVCIAIAVATGCT
jgi:mRNA interferase MazF